MCPVRISARCGSISVFRPRRSSYSRAARAPQRRSPWRPAMASATSLSRTRNSTRRVGIEREANGARCHVTHWGALRASEDPPRGAFLGRVTRLWLDLFTSQNENVGLDRRPDSGRARRRRSNPPPTGRALTITRSSSLGPPLPSLRARSDVHLRPSRSGGPAGDGLSLLGRELRLALLAPLSAEDASCLAHHVPRQALCHGPNNTARGSLRASTHKGLDKT